MRHKIVIGWLYPDLMSTYGDRGNIIVLKKRCEWRGIEAEIKRLDLGFKISELKECDILFMGGAQDRQQQIVSKDFTKDKIKALKDTVEQEVPGLYICGAYQFLGKYYKEANGTIIDGLNILDLYTENPGEGHKRLIGDVIIRTNHQSLASIRRSGLTTNHHIVGFENHGGRTYLGKNIDSLGEVLVGFGNNGTDKTEGAVYKNSIGSYFHGPILPKNPEIADFLIAKALEVKYKKRVELEELDDSLENITKESIVKKYLH